MSLLVQLLPAALGSGPCPILFATETSKRSRWNDEPLLFFFLPSMSPFCFHFSTVIAKKTSLSPSLSLVHRPSSFPFPLFYSHPILCRERSLLRSIHNSSETQKERNGMRSQIKKAKKKKKWNAKRLFSLFAITV